MILDLLVNWRMKLFVAFLFLAAVQSCNLENSNIVFTWIYAIMQRVIFVPATRRDSQQQIDRIECGKNSGKSLFCFFLGAYNVWGGEQLFLRMSGLYHDCEEQQRHQQTITAEYRQIPPKISGNCL